MNPFANKSEEEIRDSWQGRALAASKDEGRLFRVIIRVFLNEYTGVTLNTWEVILRMCIKGYVDLQRPLLLGYARVELSGRVTSEVVDREDRKARVAVYRHKGEFIAEIRKFADRLKFNDADRVAMFDTLKTWITEDKTIGLHGERLAS